ncbi:MAG: DUF2723 domain-containing protein [Ardenticatenales bacterium]|nr:DUF2723 domain-containing protein [Ardenticatenales bacterium]
MTLPSSHRLTWVVALLLLLSSFALYTATLVPGPFDGDSGEFQYLPRILGLPHPTGFPLYLMSGWLWSWLPVGTLAWRMNLFSAFCAAGTIGLLFLLLRSLGLRWVASVGGAMALLLAPGFWRYAVVADVYAMHTLLLAAALFLWHHWSMALDRGEVAWTPFWQAAFVTGLGLTNHPTFAFILPAVLLFVLAHLTRFLAGNRLALLRNLLIGGLLFALPGLLYLYVPLRLWMLGPGDLSLGMGEHRAKGIITPYIAWDTDSVLGYLTGRSFISGLTPEWWRLPEALPELLVADFGIAIALLGLLGTLFWLWQRPRSFLLLATLFLPSATYGITFVASIAAIGETLDPATYLLPALLVFSLWVAQGLDSLVAPLAAATRRAGVAEGAALALLLLALGSHHWGSELPVRADREKSLAIRRYWSEVLAYPLEPGAALTGHWGDLTAFWYFQHGEERRPDLWAIFPPDIEQIEQWLAKSGRPLYLAGPLLDWGPELAERYSLVPWGILVRIAPPEVPALFPPLTSRQVVFNDQLQLEGYRMEAPGPGQRQLWLAWHTTAPTSRDLSVSLRLHSADGSVLLQKDGRLASLWYPDGTLPAGLPLLTVFDLELPAELPAETVARIVVYDPATSQPLFSAAGDEVVELGPFR